MPALASSLALTVSAQKRACVLDTPLALSRHGLLLAKRLCGELDLWLVRELWGILDNNRYYLEHPEQLSRGMRGEGAPGAERKAAGELAGVFRRWEAARVERDLAGLKLFWVGDALCESLFPEGIDPNLAYRFEILAGALERRAGAAKVEKSDVLSDCFRDAAALSAALIPYRSFILTLRGERAAGERVREPLLCTRLRRWNIQVKPIDADDRTRHERQLLRQTLARMGITELLWAGLGLAAVHLVVPEAVAMRPPNSDDGGPVLYPPEIEAEGGPCDWWAGAGAYWYSL